MHEPERLTPEDSQFADALAALTPLRPNLEFRQIWMESQHRRWRRQARLWRGVAAVLAAGLIVSLLLRPRGVPAPDGHDSVRPTREVVRQLPHESIPAPPRQPLPVVLAGDDYIALRSRVLVFGIDAIQPPQFAELRSDPKRPIDGSLGASEPRPRINLFGPFSSGSHS